jgi:alkylation response protein AidB-like acyl-CoA dehydrogenase
MSVSAAGGKLVERARGIADGLLWPAAAETDAAEVVPAGHLDALAEAGFYGLGAPAAFGGTKADLATACAAIELLAGADLTDDHVRMGPAPRRHPALANSPNEELKHSWLPRLCRGSLRAGLILAGALPGPAPVEARPAADRDGWSLAGAAPWLSGWTRIDVIAAAARDEHGNAVWARIDAAESQTLEVEPVRLFALNASRTVRVRFKDHHLPAERVAAVVPAQAWSQPNPASLRIHAKRWSRARLLASLSPRSMERYLRELMEFSRWLADRDVASPSGITRELLEAYMLYVRTRRSAQSTRRRRLGALRAFLEDQRDDGPAGLPRTAAIQFAEDAARRVPPANCSTSSSTRRTSCCSAASSTHADPAARPHRAARQQPGAAAPRRAAARILAQGTTTTTRHCGLGSGRAMQRSRLRAERCVRARPAPDDQRRTATQPAARVPESAPRTRPSSCGLLLSPASERLDRRGITLPAPAWATTQEIADDRGAPLDPRGEADRHRGRPWPADTRTARPRRHASRPQARPTSDHIIT